MRRITFSLFPAKIMPNLWYSLHAPKDRADGAQDIGRQRNIGLGSHVALSENMQMCDNACREIDLTSGETL